MRRWLLRLAMGLVLLVLLLAVGAILALRTDPGRAFVLARAIEAIEGSLDARVSIGRLRGPVLRTLVLEDVRIRTGGRTFAEVPRIEVAYGLLPLLGGTVRIDRLVLDRPYIHLAQTADGWVVPTARDTGGPSTGSPPTVIFDGVRIDDGRLAVAWREGERVRRVAATELDLAGSARIAAGGWSMALRSLRFAPRGVALAKVRAKSALTATSDGRIDVTQLDVRTARSRIVASGVVHPDARVDARAALAPLSAADVRAIVPSVDLLADVDARARARGPWKAIAVATRIGLGAGGRVALDGTVDAAATPLRWDAHAFLGALDPGAIVAGVTRASLTGRVDVAGTGVDAAALRRYAAALHDSSIEGREVTALSLTGRSDGTVHRVRGDAVAPLGKAAIDARVALVDPIEYAARTRFAVDRLELLVPSTWGWVAGSARVRGRGTAPDTRRASLRLSTRHASVHGLPIDRVAARADLLGRQLALDPIAVASRDLGIDVHGTGRVGIEGGDTAFDGKVAADLGAVGRYMGRVLRGGVTATVNAKGTAEAVAVRADARVRQPAYDAYSADDARIVADLHGLGGAVAGGTVDLTATRARRGTSAPYAVAGKVDWKRQHGTDRADVALSARADDGTLQRALAAIDRNADRTLVNLRDLRLVPPQGPPWQLAGPGTLRIDDAVAFDGVALVSGAQRAAVRGHVALAKGTSAATITLTDVDLKVPCALGGGPACAGRLGGRVDLTGTAAAPIADVTLAATDVKVSEVAYGRIEASAAYAGRRTKLAATLAHPRAGTLRLQGEVPVDLAWAGEHPNLANAPVDLTLTAQGLDPTFLAALAPGAVKAASGRLDVNLRIDGPRSAPRPRGDVVLSDASLTLAATGIAYEHIHGRLSADGTRMVVQQLQAKTGDGTADVTGAIQLAPPVRSLDLQVRVKDFFAVKQTAYEATVSGDVKIGGNLDAPDVTGRLEVEHALVRPAALPASEPVVPDDSTIVVVGRPVKAVEAPPAGPTIAESIRLGVTIEVERNAWIRRSDAEIELGGRLQVTKTPGQPIAITGEIQLVRGWYAFQGRRFQLEEGSRIVFGGQAPPAPTFDITAFHTTQEYRIEVHITGSAEKPNLELSSTPALEKADILAVLLFGKRTQDLGRGESDALQQKALALAAGYVVPELRTSVMNTLGLETLEVQMPEGVQPGKVSAGRYVSDDVFVSLGQEFGRRAAQVVGLEYYLGRNVSVRASTSTRGDSAIDLLWRYRY